MSFSFTGSHILSADQFDLSALTKLFQLAQRMETIANGEVTCNVLQGNILGSCFFEESTRTRWSSEAAFIRLGGSAISMTDPKFSSMFKKKETFEDTIRVLSCYVDAIVIRHPEEGKAAIAAQHSNVPIINGGDGKKEHPTQALLDMFTIQQELGRLNNFAIAMAGDLARGRTVHSLMKLLSLYSDIQFNLIASDSWQMPDELVSQVQGKGHHVIQTDDFAAGIENADIAYMVRPQNERSNGQDSDAPGDNFCLDAKTARKCKKLTAIMHPLPRNEEIPPEVDQLKEAAYFRQAKQVPLKLNFACPLHPRVHPRGFFF